MERAVKFMSARQTGLRRMGRAQKVRMFKRAPRNPENAGVCNLRFRWKECEKSKSVRDVQVKTDLCCCKMQPRRARKAEREKVQVDATLRDGGLCSPQGRMCPKEIYET